MSLVDPTQALLEAAMRGAQLRQTLLTSNLANANTPGYQRQDVNFEQTLRDAVDAGTPPSDITFTPQIDNQTIGADGNGVSPDQESANIAENGLEYQALVQVTASRNTIIQWAMGAH